MVGLDMLAFQALVESSTRVNAANKIEQAWAAMCAAQATGKEMKKLTKGWEDQTHTGKVKPSDEKAVLARFGKGI